MMDCSALGPDTGKRASLCVGPTLSGAQHKRGCEGDMSMESEAAMRLVAAQETMPVQCL